MVVASMTQAKLKALVQYDPLSGLMTWRHSGKPVGNAYRNASSGAWYQRVTIDGRSYLVSRSENARNVAQSKRNRSGCTGVCWHSTKNKWHSYIMIDGKQKHIGYFADQAAAIEARLNAEQQLGFDQEHGKRPSIRQRQDAG